jgi:hypothetical protein
MARAVTRPRHKICRLIPPQAILEKAVCVSFLGRIMMLLVSATRRAEKRGSVGEAVIVGMGMWRNVFVLALSDRAAFLLYLIKRAICVFAGRGAMTFDTCFTAGRLGMRKQRDW